MENNVKYIIPDLITGEEIEVSYEIYKIYCEIMDSLEKFDNE